MMNRIPPIQPLPSEVAAQIKSSASVNTLSSAIVGLVKNSLDANAHTIGITVDFHKGGCVVEDDGVGIPSIEFRESGGLGKLHHTSKFDCSKDVYGHSGIFLSSLASLSLITITSRNVSNASDASTSSITYHHSKVISRLCPAPPQYELTSEHGTKVTVANLFGNLPVRVKHRALALQKEELIDKEWNDLKRLLINLLIASRRITKLVLQDPSKSRKLTIQRRHQQSEESPNGNAFDVNQVHSILCQAGYVQSAEASSWVTISARAPGITVQSVVSLTPSPTRQVQFISFGIHPLDRQSNSNILYDEINRLFAASTFGSGDGSPGIAEEIEGLDLKDNAQHGVDTILEKRQKSRAKGVDRWPMFCIRIHLDHEQNNNFTDIDDQLSSDRSLTKVVNVIHAMIRQFLEQHDFQPRRLQSRRKHPRDISSLDIGEEVIAKKLRHSVTVAPLSNKNNSVSSAQEQFLNPELRLPNQPRSRAATPSILRRDFPQWTRVKSGRKENIDEELCSGLTYKKSVSTSSDNTSNTHEPLNEIPRSASIESTLVQPCTTRESQARASADVSCQGNMAVPADSEPSAEQQDSRDQFIKWADPVTKETLYINERTGQTLSSKANPVLPFRFRSSTPRPASDSSFTSLRPATPSTPWFDSILQNWKNPVFRPAERPIQAIRFATPAHSDHESGKSCGGSAVATNFENIMSSSFSGRLTKFGLANAEIISQVDKKFLLLKMTELPDSGPEPQQVLVLVDQHAADERVRVEQLFVELCGSSPSHAIDTTRLSNSVEFKVSSEEAQLFRSRATYFASWGCLYSVSGESISQTATVTVSALPTLISERCRIEPKLVIDILRTDIWAHKDNSAVSKLKSDLPVHEEGHAPHWLQSVSHCPRGVIELLNSRACRSAIMFNDELSEETSRGLIDRLAKCVFPFHCAHGRPSMVPVLNLGGQENLNPFGYSDEKAIGPFENHVEGGEPGFGQAWKKWMQL